MYGVLAVVIWMCERCRRAGIQCHRNKSQPQSRHPRWCVPQWCRATTCAKWTASWETEAPSTPSGPRATGEAHSHAHYEDNTSVDHGHGSLRIHRNNRASLSQPAIHTDRFDKEANVRPIRHCHCRRSRCCPCPRWVMPVPVLRVVEGWQCCRPRECVGIG